MARLLDGVRGHKQTISRLLKAADQDRLASSFLFVGPDGVGRKRVARALAQAWACEKSNEACGFCSSCLRVASHQSEAVLEIEPDKNQIKIEQAKSILDFLSLQSLTKSRMVIIDSAHLMNPQAANALLKSIEEPPPNTYFILIAPSTSHVLPTIRSRSQIVHFQSLTENDLRQEKPAPEWAIRSALGSFSRLQNYLDRDEIQLRALSWQILNQWQQKQAVYLNPESREWMKDRQTLLSLSRYWFAAFRDASFYLAGERERLFNADQLGQVKKIAELQPDCLNQVLRLLLDLEQSLLTQKDTQLSFEQFWILSLREVESHEGALKC